MYGKGKRERICKNMQITIVLPGSPRLPSGGTKVVYEYANYLSQNGHHVEIAYMTDQMWSRFGLPDFIRRPLIRLSVFYRPRWFPLDKHIKKYPVFEINNPNVHDSDIIIATAVNTASPIAQLSAEKGKKCYFIQGFENWEISDTEVYETYTFGMKNITVAHWLSEIVDLHSKEKSICIPNSIDTSIFKVINPINNRKKHSLVFHYRAAPYKGAEYAFETIKILEKQYSDLEVTVVGTEKAPKKMPVCCIYIRGATPQRVAEINNNASIFMCTSVVEGFGLPGLEAMACGCALVSSDYEGVHEYAENGVTALISPVKDPKAMAKNIENLFEDDSYRIKLADNAAKMTVNRSLDMVARKFEEAICGD